MCVAMDGGAKRTRTYSQRFSESPTRCPASPRTNRAAIPDSGSDSPRRFYPRVWVIALEFEILQFVIKDGFRLALDDQFGQRPRLAFQLFEHDVVRQVVLIQMTVAKRMNKLPHFQITLLGDHMRQQRVRGNIERHAQKQVGTALVKLTRQLAVGHVELEQAVARRQCHAAFTHVVLRANGLVRQFCRVPGGDDQAPGVGFGANLVDDFADLVDNAAVVALPAAPLFAVDRPQVAVFEGPFVPDADFAFRQPGVVGGAFQEPQQFVDDAAQVHFFGGDKREAVLQVEADLSAEYRAGTYAGAVAFVESVVDYVLHQVEVGFHWAFLR